MKNFKVELPKINVDLPKIKEELPKIENEEKIGLIAGISLIVQSAVFTVLSIVLWGKKRTLAKTFAAVAAVSGVIGALLVVFGKKKNCRPEEEHDEEDEDLFGESFDEDDVFCNFENEGEDCCCGNCDEDAPGGEENENA
ncbi:MAG: hypothetical protein IJK33_01450 [Clostridia bacterium]|nr:hypothetical protein [Clostridia bacterium]MBQ6182538.1 hypothetical protein [Clostridia bacterium]